MSKINKEQIQKLDVSTLLMAVDWLFDANRRLDMASTVGRQTKTQIEYNRAMASCRRHCLEQILTLAEYATGRRGCADQIDLITCNRCDGCGWPVIQNYGDEYSILCAHCAGVYKTGQKALDYINEQTKRGE